MGGSPVAPASAGGGTGTALFLLYGQFRVISSNIPGFYGARSSQRERCCCLFSQRTSVTRLGTYAAFVLSLAGVARRGKQLARGALRIAAFGSLLRVLRLLALLVRARAGPHRHALAARRGRAGVQCCVFASNCVAAHVAKLCIAGQMWLVWCAACVYDG